MRLLALVLAFTLTFTMTVAADSFGPCAEQAGHKTALAETAAAPSTVTITAGATKYGRMCDSYSMTKTVTITGATAATFCLQRYSAKKWKTLQSATTNPDGSAYTKTFTVYGLKALYKFKVTVAASATSKAAKYAFTATPKKQKVNRDDLYIYPQYHLIGYYFDNCPKGKVTFYYKGKKLATKTWKKTKGRLIPNYKIPAKYRHKSWKNFRVSFKPDASCNYFASFSKKKLARF
jgi:hypothetical protein